MRKIILLSLLFFVSISCKKDEPAPKPQIDFSYTFGQNGNVSFSSTSNNTTSLIWEFGDGSTSIDNSPSHTYLAAGTYNVTLTAKGEGGTASVSKSITPTFTKPKAEYTFTIGDNGIVYFTNKSTDYNSVFWDFGDGKTSSEFNPTHVYEQNANYQVTLKTSGNGGTDVNVKTVSINNKTGSLVIYKRFSTGQSNINVWVDGVFIGAINGSYYFSSGASCGNPQSVTVYNLRTGSHSIIAKETSLFLPKSWSSTFVTSVGCNSFGLN